MDPLNRLPPELLYLITSYLEPDGVNSVRLSCLSLSRKVSIRLSRVFLSANPLNVRIFRAIADHDIFRNQVVEIIWDDARLEEERATVPSAYALSEYQMNWVEMEWPWNEPRDLATSCDSPNLTAPWFEKACRDNLQEWRKRKGSDTSTREHVAIIAQIQSRLPIWESWILYQHLLDEQREVIRTGADIEAFRYGVQRFPCLKRVTITPAAHGFLYQPLYRTPMIRAFQYGFSYAVPRGWPDGTQQPSPYSFSAWETQENEGTWRTFRAVIRELARNKEHDVQELIIDAHGLYTGLNSRLFENPASPEYRDMLTLLQRQGFRRLDLDLCAFGEGLREWSTLRGGHLRNLLGEAPGLLSISIGSYLNAAEPPLSDYSMVGNDGKVLNHVPLGRVFPVEKWPSLRHFEISGWYVTQADLITFLNTLPPTVRSVRLQGIKFLGEETTYYRFLDGLRSRLDWKDRSEARRIRLSLSARAYTGGEGRAVWVDDAVNEFIYNGGLNPFKADNTQVQKENQVWYGMGIVKDAFDPSFTRPLMSSGDYYEQGIYEADDKARDPFGSNPNIRLMMARQEQDGQARSTA